MIQLRDYVEDEYEYVVKCIQKRSCICMIRVDDNFDITDYIASLSPIFPPVLSNIIIEYCPEYSFFMLTPSSPDSTIFMKHDYSMSVFFGSGMLILHVCLSPNHIKVVHTQSISFFGLAATKFVEEYCRLIESWLTQLRKN